MTATAMGQDRQGVGVQLAMTALTLAIVGAYLLWQGARPGRAPEARHVAVERAAGSAATPDRLGAAPAVPVTDQEMYQAWQASARTAAVGDDAP